MSVELIDATEDWFVRIGIPHFIDDFKASEDVWTRAIGFLTLVFFGELFLTFGPEVDGWHQLLVFVLGVVVAFTAIAAVNRLRGRSAFSRPNTIGFGELALFVIVPPLLAVLGGHDTLVGFLGVAAINVGILLVTYLLVAWALFPMIRWGLFTMWDHLSQIAQLLGRILPLMLLFSAFLFLNAEIWQVVNDFAAPLYVIVLTALVLIGLSFLVGAMKGAIQELRWFNTWEEVAHELDDTPMEGFDPCTFDGTPRRVPLTRKARANLTVRLVVGLGAQVLLVTGIIFGFYVLFGVLTVREDTVLQWTTLDSDELADSIIGDFSIFGHELIITRLHLIASGFVAAFSGLQFAVSLVTDEAYKRDFVQESNAEVRQAIAVRAVYLRLARLSGGSPDM